MKKMTNLLLAAALALPLLAACSPATGGSTTAGTAAGTTAQTSATDKPFAGETLSVMLAYGNAQRSFEKFTEKTGIKIEYLEISTGKALAQIQAEGGKTTSDVWFGGGVDSYLAAKDLGYLEKYVSPEAAAVDPQFKDAEGYWTGLALVPAGFLVNNDVLKEKGLEAPKTWADLADPKYKGEIIMADPAISGTQYAILAGLIQAMGEEAGWDLWTKIDANIEVYAKGGGEPAPKTGAGEYAIGVLALTGGTYELTSQYPVSVIAPSDYIPWTPAPIGIFASSTKKEAAKVLVDYMLSKEGQEELLKADARIMTHKDVAIPDVMKDIDTNKLVKQDITLFGSQREALLAKWTALVEK